MRFGLCAAAAGLALFASIPSFADDSTASLGMGGVVLTKNADIRMASEDLKLSPNAVSVRYEFTNDSGKDIDTIVAFPLPDVDLYEFWESPMGTVKPQSPNFVGFTLTVDGKTNPNAAWIYRAPKPAAANIKDHVAFWHGVDVCD